MLKILDISDLKVALKLLNSWSKSSTVRPTTRRLGNREWKNVSDNELPHAKHKNEQFLNNKKEYKLGCLTF